MITPISGLMSNYWCGADDPTAYLTLTGYGNTTAIGAPTYFGTTAQMNIQPDITCNPTSGLASKQIAKLGCFALPSVGSNGPRNLPYIKLGAFWGSDLAIGQDLPHRGKTEPADSSFREQLAQPSAAVLQRDQSVPVELPGELPHRGSYGRASSRPRRIGDLLTPRSVRRNQRILQLEAKYSF